MSSWPSTSHTRGIACLFSALLLSTAAITATSTPNLECGDGEYLEVRDQQSDGMSSVVTFQVRRDPGHQLSIALVSYETLELPGRFDELPTEEKRRQLYTLLGADVAELLEGVSETRLGEGEIVHDGEREFFRIGLDVGSDQYSIFYYASPLEHAALIGRFMEGNTYSSAIAPTRLLHDALAHCTHD
ncbi:MAG: hypothetical protein JJU06_13395 [Ectothiorhodospiraceae bacterium]|nr:hypothetical protein [Ectothiorhodospiraceae bacterium]MCH8504087.1 hypothetical protein [Ectothiorhodospiraceae bacterium]